MEYYLNNNIIQNPIHYYQGVRDDPDINVFKDTISGALVLDKIKETDYEKKV